MRGRPRSSRAARRSPPQQTAEQDACRERDAGASQRILLDVLANLAYVLLDQLRELVLGAPDSLRRLLSRTPNLSFRLRNTRRCRIHLVVSLLRQPLRSGRVETFGFGTGVSRSRRHDLLLRRPRINSEKPATPTVGRQPARNLLQRVDLGRGA